MTTIPAGYQFRSKQFQEIAEAGEARGEALGEGRAVLTVLEARGVQVPQAIREQVLACTDLGQLDTWLRRAVTAKTTADVFGD